MAFDNLNATLVGQDYLPKAWQKQLGTQDDPANGQWYTTGADGSDPGGIYGAIYDRTGAPNFDQSSAVYQPSQVYAASTLIDNRTGARNQIGNIPSGTLEVDETNGQTSTSTHTLSASVTTTVSEAVNVNFEVVGSTTTFTFSSTIGFSAANSQAVFKGETTKNTIPLNVPEGKAWQLVEYYLEETLDVPYTLGTTAEGTSYTWFSSRQGPADRYNYVLGVGDLFGIIRQDNISAGDGGQFQRYNSGGGAVLLTGTAHVDASGNYQSKIFDVTSILDAGGDPQPGQGTQINGPMPKPMPDGSREATDPSVASAPSEPAATVPAATTPAALLASDPSAVVASAPSASAATASAATTPSAPMSPDPSAVGVHHIMGDAGEEQHGTANDDWIEGGAGADRIIMSGGEDWVFGLAGDDYIENAGGSGGVYDGGAGNDHIRIEGPGKYTSIIGGTGNDLLEVYAPSSLVRGGTGDDAFVLDKRGFGSVIVDADGSNTLTMSADTPFMFYRIGSDLYIRTDAGATAYNRDTDVVWMGFFSGDNSVNGQSAQAIAAEIDARPPEIDWQAVAADVQANYDATGKWFASDSVLAKVPNEIIDWTALAAEVQANFDRTGFWDLPAAIPTNRISPEAQDVLI